ncbi:hypothetical protein K3495_g5526 [Podosphaera aphanis]|nr:hypothetical protein K3495_g5526 [Podosphaera aphanis]
MPYIPNTPESRLPRSDSKNPSTTCNGITNDGRPCRRPRHKGAGENGFCWQHRDQEFSQAERISTSPPKTHKRTSVDTLVDRLGILDVNSGRTQRKPSRSQIHNNKRSSFCCFGFVDDLVQASRPITNLQGRTSDNVPNKHQSKISENTQTNQGLFRPALGKEQSSRTGEYLSLISPQTSPEIASSLLAELAKPISSKDEAGFIYMFWLTPESLPDQPSSDIASSFLAKPPSNLNAQRALDVPKCFTAGQDRTGNRKILLKIGRAQNVHRRLNQWTRQCGYNLSLIRYYPYRPTASSKPGSENESAAKAPNIHKVERLIHIELSEKRAPHEKCDMCGKEHKEWFQVEASRKGVKEVDEIIRRWVDWNVRSGTSK